MSTSPRQYIFEQLQGVLPDTFKFEDRLPTLGAIAQPVAWIEYTSFGPLAEAPVSAVAAVASLCMVSHRADLSAAQAAIDDAAWDTYIAIAEKDVFYSVTATKDVWEERFLGWRINLTTIYSLTETEE